MLNATSQRKVPTMSDMFKLTITFAERRTLIEPLALAEVLDHVAHRVSEGAAHLEGGLGEPIIDTDGVTVGSFTVTAE